MLPLHAQRLSVAARAGLVEHRVDAGFGVERALGLVAGVEGAMRLGARGRLAVIWQGGSLGARGGGATDRDIGEIRLEGGARASSWLEFRTSVTRRVFTTALARQRWAIVGLGATARAPLTDRLEGILAGDYAAVAAVNGLPHASVAFAAASGLAYRSGPRTLRLLYGLERYEFPGGRLEQLGSLLVSAEWRLGSGRR